MTRASTVAIHIPASDRVGLVRRTPILLPAPNSATFLFVGVVPWVDECSRRFNWHRARDSEQRDDAFPKA